MAPRTRVYGVVGLACAAAAAVAIGVAWSGRGATADAAPAPSGPRDGAPPLALDVLVEDPGEAAALQRAARLYEDGRRAAAREAFAELLDDGSPSLYAQVGEGMARWPNGTLPRLRELEGEHPRSGLVKLHLGLVLFWLRRDAAATAAWRDAEAVEPDASSAVRAETLLHPEMPQGRPFFVPSAPVPADVAELLPMQQLAELKQRAEDAGDAESWIRYGVALQRSGRSVSAAEAFDRAAQVAPDSPEALAAAAVVRFDKDDPSQAFSQLGPLGQRFPEAGVVKFHLGLMLLWLRDVSGAHEQLQDAVRLEPGSIYAREAAVLISRLDEARAGAATNAP